LQKQQWFSLPMFLSPHAFRMHQYRQTMIEEKYKHRWRVFVFPK